jgi:hypothetical protein
MSHELSQRLLSIIRREADRLKRVGETRAAVPPGPGKWSPKEVLGHLVDSAANNHQRFVRALLAPELDSPGYSQSEWVACQGYAEEEWGGILALWEAYNRHLAHVIARIPEGKRAAPVRVAGGAPMTLEALAADYLRHLEHHLAQIAP